MNHEPRKRPGDPDGTETQSEFDGVRWLSDEEWLEIVDEQAKHYLNMSGEEFINTWHTGKFDDNQDRPEVMRVVMLLPLDLQRS